MASCERLLRWCSCYTWPENYDKRFPPLALIFHLIDQAAGGSENAVTEGCALPAAAWCRFLEPHARRCYGLLADEGLRSAQALARKLKEYYPKRSPVLPKLRAFIDYIKHENQHMSM